jgi:hypothetical protein
MSDLTTQEQAHVRTALQFLRARCGGWNHALGEVRGVSRNSNKLSSGSATDSCN